MTTTEARESFAETTNRVVFTGQRIVLHRFGKPVVALVSMEDVAILEALEDQIDAAAARKALSEPGPSISSSQAKKELGL